jgi:hypothetical protein
MVQFILDLFATIGVFAGVVGFIVICLGVAVVFRALGMDARRQRERR